MPNLSIKDVPEAWAQALRQRAQRNHRSLQGELMALVEAAVAPVLASAAAVPQQPSAAAASLSVAVPAAQPVPGQRKSIEQVVQALRRRFPEPVQAAPLARDIIRAERDARGLR